MTKDRSFALAVGVFIVIMYIESMRIPEKTSWQVYGSAFYPRILLGIMGVLALFLLINSFRNKKTKGSDNKFIDLPGFWKEYNEIIFLFVAFGVYVFILSRVGFILSTALYLFISMAILMGVKNKKDVMLNITVTVIATLSVFAIFNYGLNVWLP
ncbi:hypothetical protein GCM10007216_03570 [Thalassobacillus devorans]|uniref:DUF1468 domain-containing protein n=1 Tax=Thalassobacillus devorans TaxID=279813 RepID=A0ABQ1NGB3_9BACI|nr:tripartite tricarboxylate transporter TctB family protein [Thalassobacillus devorans]NIK27265.1 putative tricarboxylic transport membrane protein [Thalassobacillus devorans]GGC76302.1 hypothetical protein GCM10007216_03570 [Thalassobacillus devorans]